MLGASLEVRKTHNWSNIAQDENYRAVFDYVFPICHKRNFYMSLSIFELLGTDASESNLVSRPGIQCQRRLVLDVV